VLNPDFTNLKVFVLDQDGDGDNEIGIGGVESKGFFLRRGVSDLRVQWGPGANPIRAESGFLIKSSYLCLT
jgi:hypothetical protein